MHDGMLSPRIPRSFHQDRQATPAFCVRMCPTMAFPPCPIARPWGGVVNVAPGIRACSPIATLEGGTQICPRSIKAFQSLVPREGIFYASLNLDEITLQRHSQLSTRGG